MQHVERDVLVAVQSSVAQHASSRARHTYRQIFINRHFIVFGIIFLTGSALFFVNPLQRAFGLEIAAVQQLHAQLLSHVQLGVQYSLATFLMGSALVGMYVVARRELARPAFWMTHCPGCDAENLQRIHRRPVQRVVAFVLSLPLYNFSCDQCKWHGIRVDHGLLR